MRTSYHPQVAFEYPQNLNEMNVREDSSIRFVFPSDSIEPKEPDSVFESQIEAFRNAGFPTSILSLEYLQMGERRIRPRFEIGETIVYRGWMMNGADYRSFEDAVTASGATLLTNTATYLCCHHLPNWYPLIADLTPKTVVFPTDADLKQELDHLGWSSYFIKDYVKSLKTEHGSLLRSTDGLDRLIADMIRFRGEIEGGFCVREVEEFLPETETRYFVIGGKPFAGDPGIPIPEIVTKAAARIASPFFSVDMIQRTDGVERIVEIGDGQVSDVVGWTPGRLAEMWREVASTRAAAIGDRHGQKSGFLSHGNRHDPSARAGMTS